MKASISCCLLLAVFFMLAFSYPPGWSDDILLTPEDVTTRSQPDVDIDGFNNVWAVWDSGNWVNNTAEILYSKRDSLGGCLIPETNVSNNVSFSHLPRICVDASNNIQFIWRDSSPLGEGIWHAKLANNGSVLIPAHLAVSGAGGVSSTLLPDIAVNKYKEINVIWDEHPLSYNQMNYTKLDSLGNPVIEKIQISPESIPALWPGIGIDSTANVHLGYRTNRTSTDSLAYMKLDKDGNVLVDYKILDTGLMPSIVADGSQNIHLVYPHPQTPYGPWVINYLKLNQDGNLLVPPKTISTYETYNMAPSLAIDSLQYLHVVWEAETSGIFPILYTKLDTMGDYIIPPMQIVYPPYSNGGGMAHIAVDHSNRLHVIWVDDRMNPGVSTDIFYKRGENAQTVAEMQTLKQAAQSKIVVSPNPFSTKTIISFSYSLETETAKLIVYDALGRQVRDLTIRRSDRALVWDGSDNDGHQLPDGVYFIRLNDPQHIQSAMVVLLR